jgi:hypothetical protein
LNFLNVRRWLRPERAGSHDDPVRFHPGSAGGSQGGDAPSPNSAGQGPGHGPYSELAEKTTEIDLEPNAYALAVMLIEVSPEEEAAGHGLLSVIVVHKHGDM